MLAKAKRTDYTHSWYKKAPENIAADFKMNLSYGLTEAEAEVRLQECGPNVLIQQKGLSALKILVNQLGVVTWVLLGAVVISFILGEQIDAVAIFAIVILNVIIGFILEYRADRAILALQQMAAPKATVFRDGHAILILAADIVPGDILLLEDGDLIAADARLFEVSALKTNEAALTGESQPIEKNNQSYSTEILLADQKNMVFMGTAVVNGTAKAIVTATGMKTEMGSIAKMLEEASRSETPLQRRLNQVGYRFLWICFAIVIVIFLLGLLRQIPIFELLMSSISLAVAAIPEGLPAVVTVALALGVQRMVRRNVLVRRLSAVETLGCLQVICADKTGTLTVGKMTARKLITSENTYIIHGEGDNLSGKFICQGQNNTASVDNLLLAALNTAAACNNAQIMAHDNDLSTVGDPTEAALLVAAAKGGIWRKELGLSYPRVKEFPVNSERKRMTVVCRKSDQLHAFVKGAPEVILERCTHVLTYDGIKSLTADIRARMQQSCEIMASEALRVLALATRLLPVSAIDDIDENIENDLVLLGFIGMQDPPHANAKGSVQLCKLAGIKPVMITGDHPDTARAIAEELDILNSDDKLVTGSELEKLSDAELANCVKNIAVYARVSAEHKLKIVRAWKKHQVIVAMTGDGVNDAPALKEASVGIAMGKTGTPVTKAAADIIVMDNNFSSIVAGVEEGRIIYDNISKTLAYLLAGNFGELMVVFVALLIGWPLPLLPIQLLWINLITDGLPAIALATDPAAPGILNRPPRHSQKPFMDAYFFSHIAFIGFMTATVTLGIFAYEYLGNGNLMQAQDAAFSVLVTAELLRAFGARSNVKSLWQVGILSNIRLFLVVSISFSLQLLIHHIPVLQEIFGVGSVSLTQCVTWVSLGIVPLIILEIYKLLKFRNAR